MLIPSRHIFRMLCGSLEQAMDSGNRFPFSRFYETEQPASCVSQPNNTTPSHPLFLLFCSLPLLSALVLLLNPLRSSPPRLLHFASSTVSTSASSPVVFAHLSLHLSSSGAESYGELPDPDKASRFWDELAQVGLPGDVDIQSLFEESGQCWAHHRCALWSQGVCVGEGQSLLNVDRSIDSGSTEVSSPHSTPDKTCL